VFIEAQDEGGGGEAIGRAKLQSNHYHQQTNTESFLQAGCPSCRQTVSKHGRENITDLLTPNSPGSSNFVSDH